MDGSRDGAYTRWPECGTKPWSLRELGQCFEKKELRNTSCPKEKVKEFQGAKLRI